MTRVSSPTTLAVKNKKSSRSVADAKKTWPIFPR
jgi:hypothetical protein